MAQANETLKVDGRNVPLSNLDKVLYPIAQFTKGQVIDYYVKAAQFILPHLKNRPITLKRYPDGVHGEFFYEKNAPKFTPPWIKRFSVPRRRHQGTIHYILINDLPTLVWVANMASLELHPFLHRAPKINIPTEIVFDFDPGEGADVLTCAQAAMLVRDVLGELGLKSFAKVSGSKGLQVYVPLNDDLNYDIVKPFAKTVAELMEQRHPDLILSKMSKSLRTGKVFIDWSQNTESKTTVSVYSLRAKSDRPYVSLPVTWAELAEAVHAKDAQSLFFPPDRALKRLGKTGDLFAPVETLKQNLPAGILSVLKQSSKSLEPYRQKRDFSKTSEPPPIIRERSAQGSTRRFVIQKHAASHLHYDFRLEMDGVLKSWAVPKGPPLASDVRRLAMPTEDHPLDYLSFEGIIPKGQYGGGTVMVWDIGTYEVVEGNIHKGYLKLYLSGKKLKGEWLLTRSRDDGERTRWYLIRAEAKPIHLSKNKADRSALSGRTMERIADKPKREWHSNRPESSGKRSPPTKAEEQNEILNFDSLPKIQTKFIPAMTAELVASVPKSEDWQYEIKLDGYRAIVVKHDATIDLFSRRQIRMNAKYPSIAAAFDALPPDTILDGEIVALDPQGKPDFSALQNRKARQPVYFYAFDILAYRGRNVMALPLRDRRLILEQAVSDLDDPVRLCPTFDFPAEDIVRAAQEQGLEGIVAKRKSSKYEPGQRSSAWVKYKTHKGQELVIGGYLPGTHGFGSLLVGYYERNRLMFVGKVRNGFTASAKLKVAKRFKGLEIERCPFANLPERKSARRGVALTKEAMKECHWLRPELVAEIEFVDWTEQNHLRHSKFVELRDDKDAREVEKEVA
jgi:bifunctional non-homologous end joining protein LigD